MSHLSDAQELMSIGYIKVANDHINFAKYLISYNLDSEEEMTEEELDDIWIKVVSKVNNDK